MSIHSFNAFHLNMGVVSVQDKVHIKNKKADIIPEEKSLDKLRQLNKCGIVKKLTIAIDIFQL